MAKRVAMRIRFPSFPPGDDTLEWLSRLKEGKPNDRTN